MTDTVHAPPAADDDAAPPATRSALLRARALNLFGLASPAANLGLVLVAPRRHRWFGLGAGIACTILLLIALARRAEWLLWTAAAVHYALVLAGLVHPLAVVRASRAWEAFGRALGRVMEYPVFGAVWFLVVTPTALILRLCGTDPLKRRSAPSESYWVAREPAPRERYERQS